MILADALVWVAIPFVLVTFCFGFIKGDNDYYDSDAYDGHGTAHPVKLEETTCDFMVKADSFKKCDLPESNDVIRRS
tara:strand:+ start:212 stop:442 length:231 start_codon:yes stop_codon:yes gene_type:complete